MEIAKANSATRIRRGSTARAERRAEKRADNLRPTAFAADAEDPIASILKTITTAYSPKRQESAKLPSADSWRETEQYQKPSRTPIAIVLPEYLDPKDN
jgi:hypothetical protein